MWFLAGVATTIIGSTSAVMVAAFRAASQSERELEALPDDLDEVAAIFAGRDREGAER